MSDNKLLTENTVRRFMKLANVDAMTDNFVTEMYAKKAKPKSPKELEEVDTEEEITEEEEVDLEENLEDLEEQEEEEEMELDAELDPDMDADMDAGMDADMDAGMDAEPEMGAADMSLTEEEAQLLISLGERLAAAMEGAGADDAPADDAPAMDDAEPEDEEEAPGMGGGRTYEENIDQEDLVNEVLKRVTKRLVAEKLKNRK